MFSLCMYSGFSTSKSTVQSDIIIKNYPRLPIEMFLIWKPMQNVLSWKIVNLEKRVN